MSGATRSLACSACTAVRRSPRAQDPPARGAGRSAGDLDRVLPLGARSGDHLVGRCSTRRSASSSRTSTGGELRLPADRSAAGNGGRLDDAGPATAPGAASDVTTRSRRRRTWRSARGRDRAALRPRDRRRGGRTCPFTTPSGERFTIFGEGGGQLLADELDVPLLAKVPLQEELRVCADRGSPLVLEDPIYRPLRRCGTPPAGLIAVTPQDLAAAGAVRLAGARGHGHSASDGPLTRVARRAKALRADSGPVGRLRTPACSSPG